jgi:Spy/CpxP family protein refolding chaperone
MRQMRGKSFGVVLVAAVAMSACGKGEEATPVATATATGAVSAPPAKSAPPPATASAEAKPNPAAEAAAAAEAEKAGKSLHRHHRTHHHGGVAMFIHMAIDSLGVPPEKKAQLEKIQANLHKAMAPSREAGRAVLTLIEEGVAAGKLDTAKIDAAVAKQEAASAKVHEATVEALNELHAALSPAERAALVDKVKAHVEVWKKVNHDEEHGSKEKGSHLAVLTEELSLTPEQVEKISAALKKDAPPKADTAALDAHIKAFETAFVADKFDAKTLTTANAANSHISKHGTARLVRFYKTILPLLTPEQRTKLAAQLKERLEDPHAAK